VRRGTSPSIVAPRVKECMRQQKTELDKATTNDELFLRTRTNSTSSSTVSKEITIDRVELGRSYSKRDAATTTRRRHRKPDPRAIAAAHDADHPAAAAPEAVTVASNAGPIRRSRIRRLPPSAGAARASPLTRRRHGGRRRGGDPSPRPPAGEDAEQRS